MNPRNRMAMLQAAMNALTEGAKNPEATQAAIDGTIRILMKEIEMQKSEQKSKARKWMRHLGAIVIHILVVIVIGG